MRWYIIGLRESTRNTYMCVYMYMYIYESMFGRQKCVLVEVCTCSWYVNDWEPAMTAVPCTVESSGHIPSGCASFTMVKRIRESSLMTSGSTLQELHRVIIGQIRGHGTKDCIIPAKTYHPQLIVALIDALFFWCARIRFGQWSFYVFGILFLESNVSHKWC